MSSVLAVPDRSWSSYQLAVFREIESGSGHVAIRARVGAGMTGGGGSRASRIRQAVALTSVLAIATAGCSAVITGTGVESSSDSSVDDSATSLADADAIASDIASDSIGADVLDSDAAADSATDSVTDSDSVTAPSKKRIFATSEAYLPNLGGLAGADAKCQALADAAKLGGTYRAWLSDSKTSAKSRLTHATVPYVLVDGTVVAADWTALTSGTLSHAIDSTEKGTVPPDATAQKYVWTSTETSGAYHTIGPTIYDYACRDWTWTLAGDEPVTAEAGRWDSAGSTWTLYVLITCRTPTKLPLYCLEQ